MVKLQYNSPVILSFFFLSLAALVLGGITRGLSTVSFFSVYRCSLVDPLAYVRFIGHVLGHADVNHFFGNMLLLLVIGPPLEEIYGSKLLICGIVLTAFVSGMFHFLLFPEHILLGASGIVFMLITLSSLSGVQGGKVPITLILVSIMYIGQEFYSILFIDDNIANLTHVIGGVCGVVYGFIVKNPHHSLHS